MTSASVASLPPMEALFEKLTINGPAHHPLERLHKAIKDIEIKSLKLMINDREFAIGTDSKLVSKMIEIYVCDTLVKACSSMEGMRCVVNPCQNSYPDCIVYVADDAYALDIKTTYLVSASKINGFTLGTYKGYFRDRTSTKNCMLPYASFKEHLCICVIYDRVPDGIVIKHTRLVDKWKIASRKQGSGNTTNIGSLTSLEDILQEKALFADEAEFNTYWQTYHVVAKP